MAKPPETIKLSDGTVVPYYDLLEQMMKEVKGLTRRRAQNRISQTTSREKLFKPISSTKGGGNDSVWGRTMAGVITKRGQKS